MKEYWTQIYKSRFFWIHLARMELKNKFRRSKLGILWTFVSPLCLTIIMSIVFSFVFNQEIVSLAPYILSGMLCWEVIMGSLVGGSFSIVGNESYIRQFNHPMTIYTLKSAIVCTVIFLISMVSLLIWVICVCPQNLLLGLLSLPLTTILFFMFAWSATTVGSYINTKYRDYPQMMPLLMQALWYLSPVLFQESIFVQNDLLYLWFSINPITHILFLIRKPFLYGTFPSPINYLMMLVSILIMALLAYYLNRKYAKNIIFYI